MKRIVALALCCLLLAGCGRRGKILVEPVYFYYPRNEFDYGTADGVIDYEAMDGTGWMDNYQLLLSEYFTGPIDEALYDPFPEGTRLLSADIDGNVFRLTLSEEPLALPEHLLTLACTCLSMTCFTRTDCAQVTVLCGSREIAIPRDSWLLLDRYIPTETAERNPT